MSLLQKIVLRTSRTITSKENVKKKKKKKKKRSKKVQIKDR